MKGAMIQLVPARRITVATSDELPRQMMSPTAMANVMAQIATIHVYCVSPIAASSQPYKSSNSQL